MRRAIDDYTTEALALLAQAPEAFTATQVRVLRGLAEGKMFGEIAAELGMLEGTCRGHFHRARLDAAVFAVREKQRPRGD